MTLKWHMSTFNTKYLPIQYEIKEEIDYWLTRMGYRFVIREVKYPESTNVGEKAEITLKIENVGALPIYNKLPFKLCIKGVKTQEYITSVDVTKWLPSEYTETVCFDIANDIANDIARGEYELQIAIGGGDKPSVAFANEMETDDTWFVLGKVTID